MKTLVSAAAVSVLVLASPSAATDARIAPAARMSVPRAAHTATLLPSGKVLVVGGCTRQSCELDEHAASAELYDPATGRFSRTGSLHGPRVGHTATLLESGSVLITGGWDRDGLAATAELYDVDDGRFTATGSLRTPRGGFTATLLRDGRVLVAGGFDGARSLPSAEIYDPATGRFAPTGSMRTARNAHAAAALADGRVLVAGGSPGRRRVTSTAEIYDPRTARWTGVSRLRVARHKHAAAALPGGSVLVLGGSDASDYGGRHTRAERYDPHRRSFTRVGALHRARYKLPDAVALLPAGRVVVAGGAREVEVYEPRRRAFRIVGRLPAELSFSTATRLRDGRVLIAGGYDERIAVMRGAWLFRAT